MEFTVISEKLKIDFVAWIEYEDNVMGKIYKKNICVIKIKIAGCKFFVHF